jgi:hypothetical protein
VRWPDGPTDQADTYIVAGFATVKEVRVAEAQDRTFVSRIGRPTSLARREEE